MVDTDALRGLIAQRRLSQAQVAKMLNITPKTFYDKMRKGVFDTDQVEHLVEILKIDDVAGIFFAKRGTKPYQI